MCCKCSVPQKKYWIWGCSAFWLLFALVLGLIWPMLSSKILYSMLELKEGSLTYNNWIEVPIPMYAEFFMFNWTNPEEVRNPNVKPHFVQMGPYVFAEHHVRNDVQFFDNSTVAYNQTRTWEFVPERSNGTLEDKVTTLNTIALTVAYATRYEHVAMKMIVNELLKFTSEDFVVTKPVREFIFEGYEDRVLDILKRLNMKKFDIPFRKFGWFVDRNGSSEYDGRYHMNTGASDIKQLGMLDMWNFKTHTGVYGGDCGRVRGTSGELWPPGDKESPLVMFLPDVCRPLVLNHAGQLEKFNIVGEKYVADETVFDNGWHVPENMCYCTADAATCPDLLPGVMNVSECKFGAPAFISFPHFYLADPHYRVDIDGMNPSKEEHEMYLAMVRSAGIPLEVKAGIQINLLMDSYSHISLFEGLPRIFMPMFWFRQAVDISEDLASQAKLAVLLPNIGVWIAYGIAGLAAIVFCVGVFLSVTKKWGNSEEHDDDNELLT